MQTEYSLEDAQLSTQSILELSSDTLSKTLTC